MCKKCEVVGGVHKYMRATFFKMNSSFVFVRSQVCSLAMWPRGKSLLLYLRESLGGLPPTTKSFAIGEGYSGNESSFDKRPNMKGGRGEKK